MCVPGTCLAKLRVEPLPRAPGHFRRLRNNGAQERPALRNALDEGQQCAPRKCAYDAWVVTNILGRSSLGLLLLAAAGVADIASADALVVDV